MIAFASRHSTPVEVRKNVSILDLSKLLGWSYARTRHTLKKINERTGGEVMTDVGTGVRPLCLVSLDALQRFAPAMISRKREHEGDVDELEALRARVMRLEQQLAALLVERPEMTPKKWWKDGWLSPAQMGEILGISKRGVGAIITRLGLRGEKPGICQRVQNAKGQTTAYGFRYSEKAFNRIKAELEAREN